MLSRIACIILGLTALAACEPQPATPSPQGDAKACTAALQSLVGANVAAITLPADRPHRVIGPNDPVTEDYNADRLNLYVDSAGRVIRVDCW